MISLFGLVYQYIFVVHQALINSPCKRRPIITSSMGQKNKCKGTNPNLSLSLLNISLRLVGFSSTSPLKPPRTMAASLQPACLDLHFAGKHPPPLKHTNNPTFLRCVSSPNLPEPDSSPDTSITRDQRKVVRIAWEKIVRWSRSLRAKAKTDVLERTRKVRYTVVLGYLEPTSS